MDEDEDEEEDQCEDEVNRAKQKIKLDGVGPVDNRPSTD